MSVILWVGYLPLETGDRRIGLQQKIAEAIEADYERHRKAAREIAAEYFDARKVLSKLLDAIYAAN